jgi:protein gp37
VSEKTGISWTHHTFNPWWGCVKVSPACTNCYAERDAKRYGFDVWGPGSDRRFFGDDHWKQPLLWNKKAKEAGERRRVFCASMADVFEVPFYPAGIDETKGRQLRDRLDRERMRLFRLIEQTPHLDWLLLTKRPHYVGGHIPLWWRGNWPHNVWMGTTAETQGWLEERIEELMGLAAKVRFLSIEPMLGEMNLRRVRLKHELDEIYLDVLTGCHEGPVTAAPLPPRRRPIEWVIAGGESGPKARPSETDWFRRLRDDCVRTGTAFHFKQHGEHNEHLIRVGRRAAGRLLDGAEWNEFPR